MESRGKEAKGHGTGVVIETSALISFLLSKQPERNAVGFLLRLVKDGTLINYTSMEALEEIRTKLAHPKIQSLYGKVVSDQRRKKTPPVLQNPAVLLRFVEEFSVLVNPSRRIKLCRDESDNKWLEIALESGAMAVITYDRDLLDLRDKEKKLRIGEGEIYILTGLEFLELFVRNSKDIGLGKLDK